MKKITIFLFGVLLGTTTIFIYENVFVTDPTSIPSALTMIYNNKISYEKALEKCSAKGKVLNETFPYFRLINLNGTKKIEVTLSAKCLIDYHGKEI